MFNHLGVKNGSLLKWGIVSWWWIIRRRNVTIKLHRAGCRIKINWNWVTTITRGILSRKTRKPVIK